MKVKDMVENINFHDSNVIKLLYENNIVKLKLDLCMWQQKDYKEGDSEQKEILLVFNAVEDYIWDSLKTEKDIDYDTILDMSYNGGIVKIILLDGEVSIITFKCDEVKIYLT